MIDFTPYMQSTWSWTILFVMALFVGMSKTGVQVVMLWSQWRGKENMLMSHWWYSPLFGLLGGFTTMIGNAAGPVMAIYLLSIRMPKLAPCLGAERNRTHSYIGKYWNSFRPFRKEQTITNQPTLTEISSIRRLPSAIRHQQDTPQDHIRRPRITPKAKNSQPKLRLSCSAAIYRKISRQRLHNLYPDNDFTTLKNLLVINE